MYANWALSVNTNRTYSSGEKRFLQFCLMNRLTTPEGAILPASEGTLVYFASFLARTVRHSTIKIYLAAVRNLHIISGYEDPLRGRLLLQKILRGILRYQGSPRIRRQPVTPRVLLAIRPILDKWLGPRDFSMIWAAFTLAFFAFLRCSEFTYPGVHKLPYIRLHYFSAMSGPARSAYLSRSSPQRLTFLGQGTHWLFPGVLPYYVQSQPCNSILSWPGHNRDPCSIFGQAGYSLGPPSRNCFGTPPAARGSLTKVSRVIVFA